MAAGKDKQMGGSGIIRCGNCGKEIGNRGRCPHCGIEPGGPTADEIFDAQSAARVLRAESQGRGARVIAILAAVMGLLLAAGIAFYFLSAQMPPPSPDPTPAVTDGASAAAPADPLAGSSAVAPDPVNPDTMQQPLIGGTAATAADGQTVPETEVGEGELTEDQAIDRVAALPEVKNWMNIVHAKAPGNKTVLRSEGLQMGRYLVHVYEDLGSHTATFGWYEVDKTTGEVVKTEE